MILTLSLSLLFEGYTTGLSSCAQQPLAYTDHHVASREERAPRTAAHGHELRQVQEQKDKGRRAVTSASRDPKR